MSEISQSNRFPQSIDTGDKNTISKMWALEQWKYIVEQKKLGNIIKYDPKIKSPFFGSDIIIYYDKNTDVYSLCHPWTGSCWFDISKTEFDRLMSTGQYYDNL
jgi:hypothetical protein